METPVMIRRITPKKVGQYFDSPYPLNDSGIELNTETECRTSWQPTSRVTPESPNFQELGQNSQGPSVQHMYIPKPSLKRILLIWVFSALIGCSLIVMTWIYFPENKIVQKSQENALTSMVSVASAMLLVIILRVVWKYGGPSLLNTNKGGNSLKFIPTDTTFNGGSASIAPTGTYQEPKLSGQSGSTAPNLGNQTPHGIGYNFEFPMADETPTNTPMTTEAGQRTNEYPVRRTFSGAYNDVWDEFLQYFENIAELNSWQPERSRRVLLSTLRGQAESYTYGMPIAVQKDYEQLKEKLNQRFGHSAMKERYLADAKLRRRLPGESLRDFGQAIEDIYRRVYPGNPDIVEENAIKSFLDKCGQSEEFRLAVKRTRPRTLQEAILSAMQEECLRIGEKELTKENKPGYRPVYEVDDGEKRSDRAAADTAKPPSAGDGYNSINTNWRTSSTFQHVRPGRRGRPYSPRYYSERGKFQPWPSSRDQNNCVEKSTEKRDLN